MVFNKQTNVPRYVVSFSLLNKDNSYLTFDDACSMLSEMYHRYLGAFTIKPDISLINKFSGCDTVGIGKK